VVRRVQQHATIQGPEQGRQYTQYTQYGVDLLNGQSNNNSQGIQSILGFCNDKVVDKLIAVALESVICLVFEYVSYIDRA
jgi:hypothetical protein